jgi:hypothetical protein
MRWPFASAAHLDDARAEVEWLRAKVDLLTDQLVRLERVSAGLRETPPEPKRPMEPIPADVQALCDAWGSDHSRRAAESKARRLYAEHRNWSVVQQMLTGEGWTGTRTSEDS